MTDGGSPTQVAWTVGAAEVGESDGWGTWTADLDGEDLRVSVFGTRPSTRPEAALTFAGPLALDAGVDLATGATVDGRWRAGFDRALAMLAPWMGADRTPALIGASVESAAASARTDRTAMCFTGGVDSFWTLLRGGHDTTDLLYVLGFDYGLGDPAGVAAQVETVNAVAAAAGLRTLLVSTDVRRHHRARPELWRWHHGAALASVGLLLADELDRLVIPASYQSTDLIPWGSRPDLDHLWSVPGVLDVVHGDADSSRIDRIFDIAEEPLVHEHLAVCWERKGPGINCGRCEKCIRTMCVLEAAGVLARVCTFPEVDLVPAIAALAPLSAQGRPFWRILLDDRVPPHLQAAVTDLLAASGSGPATDAS